MFFGTMSVGVERNLGKSASLSLFLTAKILAYLYTF